MTKLKHKHKKAWTTVIGRKKNKRNGQVTISTAKNDGSNGLLVGDAKPKKAWFYVGNVTNKEATWIEWLEEDDANEDYTVEKLNNVGPYSSFKIGAPIRMLAKMNDADFWPPGVLVRRFNLPKTDNEDDKKPETVETRNYSTSESNNFLGIPGGRGTIQPPISDRIGKMKIIL
ncbi:hypothetical protein JTB14_003227 [Gonioctena quinquepunctata]|nr:hypothetical protein JTB14_003227 [Gonioctena quinquepunctata]